jgi:hypothetical protein
MKRVSVEAQVVEKGDVVVRQPDTQFHTLIRPSVFHGGKNRRFESCSSGKRRLSAALPRPLCRRTHRMTTRQPVATELDPRFSSSSASATPWTDAQRALTDARIYWITTVRHDLRPHVTPLIGLWIDDAFYFCTGPGEQ